MRRISLFLVLGVPLLFARLHFLCAQSTASIEGVVLEDDTNRPLANVLVSVTPGVAGSYTNAEGHFRLVSLDPGRYRVSPNLQGFVYSRPGNLQSIGGLGVWVQVASGAGVRDLRLHMVRSGVITGRATVIEPLSLSVVPSTARTYVSPNGGSSYRALLLSYQYDDYGDRHLAPVPNDRLAKPGSGSGVTLDDVGQYRFFGVPPGKYYVSLFENHDQLFYPGVRDEAMAVPVEVRAGEVVQLTPMTFNVRKIVTAVFTWPSDPLIDKLPKLIEYRDGPLFGGTLSFVWGENVLATPRMMFHSPPIHQDIIIKAESPPDINAESPTTFFYSPVTLEAGREDMDMKVTFIRGIPVTGDILIETDKGSPASVPGVTCLLHPDSVGASSRSSPKTPMGCIGKQYARGLYHLELNGMPPDAYVISAKIGDQDFLSSGIHLDRDSEIHILLGNDGGFLKGTIHDKNGGALSGAMVALVPDAPMRGAGPLYRSVISDPEGNFELHGIGPGPYHIFAWAELEGAAYRNAEFIKEFEDRGMPIQIEKSDHFAVDLNALVETKASRN